MSLMMMFGMLMTMVVMGKVSDDDEALRSMITTMGHGEGSMITTMMTMLMLTVWMRMTTTMSTTISMRSERMDMMTMMVDKIPKGLPNPEVKKHLGDEGNNFPHGGPGEQQ